MAALPTIEWTTIETAYPAVSKALDMLSADKELLTALVHHSWQSDHLRAKCEIHSLDDKIVLWDEPERGYRVRLRLAHTQQYERVHNHRFSFGAKILHGQYEQNLYRSNHELNENAKPEDFRVVSSRIEPAGSVLCIDHNQLHTTLTPPDTISLMIQSPAKKRKAFIMRLSDGNVWWRLGEVDETSERRQEVLMDQTTYDNWVQKLVGLGLIHPH